MKYIKIKNFRHAWLLLYFPIFILWFFLDEKFIVGQYTSMYFWLDSYIHFNEFFVIPYVLWYPFLGAVGLYLFFRDELEFCRYMWALIIGISFCLALYIVYPNGQDLRPEKFVSNNVFTWMVGRLYSTDSNLNVFPSIHVVATIAPTVALLKNKEAGKNIIVKFSSIILCISICLSTVFIKQHSIIDLFGGTALYLIIYLLIYIVGSKWKLWTWPALPFKEELIKIEIESHVEAAGLINSTSRKNDY